MNIKQLQKLYAAQPQVAQLKKALEDKRKNTIVISGLLASSAPMVFSGLAMKTGQTILFIMQDADEAGYFYHDLCQVMGDSQVLFFPSSYRRAIKYGQKDPANEILRTEVLTRLNDKLETRTPVCPTNIITSVTISGIRKKSFHLY